MELSERLRIAVVGTVHPHSGLYQELLHHMDEVEVTAIYDDGGAVIEALDNIARYDSLKRLIEAAAFDAALVTLPNDRRALILELLAAGKHVLADKPVCRNAREMQEIVAAVHKAGVRFAVGYQNRFQPGHAYAKALLRDNKLGRIFAVQSHLFTTDVETRDPNHFLFHRKVSGGGILHWLGCHMLDLMLDLIDDEVETVSGHVAKISDADIDVEDVGSVSLRFRSGTIGTLLAGYSIPFRTDTPYRDSPKSTQITLWGSKGRYSYDPMGTASELELYEPDEDMRVRKEQEFALPPFPGYTGWLGRQMILDFVASIAEGRQPRAAAEDNLKVLQILDAVYGQRDTVQP